VTRVDFYILEDTSPGAGPLFACRLTEKAMKQGHCIYINTASDQQLRQLDDQLWSFRAGSFLPHTVYNPGATQAEPVLLGHATEPDGPDDVLVNLAPDVPLFFSRFKRVVELVCGDENQRAAARERYGFYRDRGYTLNTHRI
jgi:DNA polymerase-3 subunit chi